MRRHCANSKLAGEGNYPDIQAARPNTVDLRSTVDYHNSLLDQARQQHELAAQHPKAHSHRGHSGPNHHSLSSLRQWLGTTVNSNSTARKKTKNERDQPNCDMALPPHPHLTRKEIEEFEALPIAIRRKYFSTLERLRLAQTVGVLDPSSPPDKELRRHHQRRGASLGTIVPGRPVERPITSPAHQDNLIFTDSAFLAKLPAKIREKHLTREEQVLVARQLRQSVILDAADEAFFKAGRLANRRPSPPPIYPPTLSSSERPSMESLLSDNASAGKRDSLYDSFRWLDEEEDLDLRLALDDYHVNLRESVPTPPKDPRSPSFRRHMSFSKVPFSRTSISSSRPATKDAQQPPPSANSTSATLIGGHSQPGRRKSRALSLITPKHAPHESISSIDPGAAHYQDPEARLKLRVYLASPQKFDEAIEFGFPSSDSSAIPYRDLPSAKGQPDGIFSPDSEKFKTFLEDDKSSIYSDDVSLPDPESPRTPDTLDKHDKSLQRPRTNDYPSRLPEAYAQVPAASREMTLRMTLTRPDLRACEDQMYGWQQPPRPYSSKPSQVLAMRDDAPISAPYTSHGAKESMDKIFADIDHELGLPTPTDNNVVKRFWNRVRRG
ncbi:hypothetical protein F4774DRAFT_109469 [Daldinia eschscholtzii]|nr:hypothetical protein F4774DRAFT_109469 [Daldinia eschscholtzii]